MRRARISKETHDKIVAAFRDQPGAILNAALAAGVSKRVARRAWESGWLNPEWARRPIRDALEAEAVAARAVIQKRINEGAELVVDDVVKQRAREVEMIRHLQGAALTDLAIAGQLSNPMTTLAKYVGAEIVKGVMDGSIPPEKGLLMLERYVRITRETSSSVVTTIDAERIRAGDPQKVIAAVTEVTSKPVSYIDPVGISDFGEEELKKAVMDLAEGRMTSEVKRLVSWQTERAGLN